MSMSMSKYALSILCQTSLVPFRPIDYKYVHNRHQQPTGEGRVARVLDAGCSCVAHADGNAQGSLSAHVYNRKLDAEMMRT